jgi:hypothetical protein
MRAIFHAHTRKYRGRVRRVFGPIFSSVCRACPDEYGALNVAMTFAVSFPRLLASSGFARERRPKIQKKKATNPHPCLESLQLRRVQDDRPLRFFLTRNDENALDHAPLILSSYQSLPENSVPPGVRGFCSSISAAMRKHSGRRFSSYVQRNCPSKESNFE